MVSPTKYRTMQQTGVVIKRPAVHTRTTARKLGSNVAVRIKADAPAMAWDSSTVAQNDEGNGSIPDSLAGTARQHCVSDRLPDSVLFLPNSFKPLSMVDLSRWQNRLGEANVRDVINRNRTFSTLTIRQIWRDGATIAELVQSHFGCFVAELDISDSKSIDDKCLTILATCKALRRLKVSQCPNVTDAGVKSIARKKTTALEGLDASYCQQVTDSGIEVVAKLCPSLRYLNLSGCPKVRDRSLFAMSALRQLEEIVLVDCFEVSDAGARQLFPNLTQLKSLNINGCPNITEEGLRFLYKAPVPWGEKRHSGCAQLTVFQISENRHVSDEIIYVLTDVCPLIRRLEVIACPLIGGDQAMGKIGSLDYLERLVFEGLQRVNEHGVQRFFSGCLRRSLTSLNLRGCTRLTDNALKYVAKYSRKLRELRMDKNVSITDKGLGYLSKGCTELRLIQASHLGMITDDGVRLVARKCVHLEDLNVSYCLQLSGGIFSSLRKLHRLQSLGICGCQNIDDRSLAHAEFHNLRHLSLGDNSQFGDSGVLAAVVESPLLVSLDLSKCTGITGTGVADMLASVKDITKVNLTNCTKIGTTELANIVLSAPAALRLRQACIVEDGFDGLHCPGEDGDARHQSQHMKQVKQERSAAVIVQWAYRRYLQKMKEKEESFKIHDELIGAAIRIQCFMAIFVAKKRLHGRAMRRARLMLSLSKWHRRTAEAKRWGTACKHGDRVMTLRAVREWRLSAMEDILESSALAERGEVFFEHQLLSSCLRAWKQYIAPMKAIMAEKKHQAVVWREERLRIVLLQRWQDNVREAKCRRLACIQALVFMLPLHYENSSRQKASTRRAIMLHSRRVQSRAWEAFISLNSELANLYHRMQKYKAWHRPRILKQSLHQLREATVVSKWGRDAKARADAFARPGKKRRAIYQLSTRAAIVTGQRRGLVRADTYSRAQKLQSGLGSLRDHPNEKKVQGHHPDESPPMLK